MVAPDWITDLYEAVLLRALLDLKNSTDYSRKGYSQRIGPEIREWFLSGETWDDGHLFSFLTCCDVLKVCPDRLLRKIRPFLNPKNEHYVRLVPVPNIYIESILKDRSYNKKEKPVVVVASDFVDEFVDVLFPYELMEVSPWG